MSTPEVSIVTAWHEALNSSDVDRLVVLSSEDIEIVGPRGSGQGSQLLHEWVGRAGIHLETRRIFHRGDTVVVEQGAQWRLDSTGQMTDSQELATVFRVRCGRVVYVNRYPDLASALLAAGLDESAEVS
jgi:hypothetical protein